MPAHQSLDKRRKMAAAKSQLRAHGGAVEGGIVDAATDSVFAASPMPTSVGGQSEPAVKVVGDAGADTTRIRFHAAAHRKQSSRKQAVYIRGRIEERVSAVELPFGSRLILPCRERTNHTQDNNRCQPHNCNPATRVLKAR